MTEHIEQLIRDLRDYRSYVRMAAYEQLMHIGDPAVSSIVAALDQVPTLVLSLLGEIDAASSVDALITLLASPERWIRMTAAERLLEKPFPQAVEAGFQFFKNLLETSDIADRADAVRCIAKSHHSQAEKVVQQSLHDPEQRVRDAARVALSHRQSGLYPMKRHSLIEQLDPGTLERLLDELQRMTRERERQVRELAKSRDPRAVTALLDLLQRTKPNADEDYSVRLAAVQALAKNGDARATPILEAIVRTDTREIDAWGMGVGVSVAEGAIRALEEIRWRLENEG